MLWWVVPAPDQRSVSFAAEASHISMHIVENDCRTIAVASVRSLFPSVEPKDAARCFVDTELLRDAQLYS